MKKAFTKIVIASDQRERGNPKKYMTGLPRRLRLLAMTRGFTLAEVLITLGIIGVVAALTIPGPVAKYQKKAWQTGLKKEYSMLAQALAQYEFDKGEKLLPEDYPSGSFYKIFMTYFRATKDCGMNGCVPYSDTSSIYTTYDAGRQIYGSEYFGYRGFNEDFLPRSKRRVRQWR
jgi:prepilin-type N-terminal cleavage/methylation domain-containing protein